jgi:phosphoserine phosphatase RsbU/P
MKHKLLLIVEDNPLLVGMYRSAFEKEGLEVAVAYNGKEGLAEIKKIKPSIVLLDILMPGMSGLDVLKELRADKSLNGTKVIILTIINDDATKNKVKELGVAEYLIKSELELAEIVKRVKSHLG